MESASCFSTSSSRQEVHSCRSSTLFFFFFSSILWFCHSVTVSIYTQRYGDIIGQRGTETYAQIHMNYITWAYSCTSTYTRQYPLKVSSMRPILSVFLCALCPCLFYTSCCHVPSLPLSVGASVICRQSWEKNQGQKCVLGGATVRQKSQKIHLCCILKLAILWFTYWAAFYNDLMYILVYMCMFVYIAATCFLHIYFKLWYEPCM